MPKQRQTDGGWRGTAKRSLAEGDAVRILKMIGAIEAMSDLLEHAHEHTYEVTEKDVFQFIERTQHQLDLALGAKEKKRGSKKPRSK